MIDDQQLTQAGTGKFPAGNKRTRQVKVNVNEAGNQRLTRKRTIESPILDQRLPVA
jgi:hypothetical protein